VIIERSRSCRISEIRTIDLAIPHASDSRSCLLRRCLKFPPFVLLNTHDCLPIFGTHSRAIPKPRFTRDRPPLSLRRARRRTLRSLTTSGGRADAHKGAVRCTRGTPAYTRVSAPKNRCTRGRHCALVALGARARARTAAPPEPDEKGEMRKTKVRRNEDRETDRERESLAKLRTS